MNELDFEIRNILQTRYPNFSVEDIEKVEENGLVYFQMELHKKGAKDRKIMLNRNGEEHQSTAYWH